MIFEIQVLYSLCTKSYAFFPKLFYCSAGINRDWVGVPRRMFKPGKKDPKCVCVKATGPSSDTGEGNEGDLNNPNMKLYPGCGKYDVSCKL